MQSQGTPCDSLVQACPSHVLSVMPLFFDLLGLQQRGRSKKSWALPLISAVLCLFFPFFLFISDNCRGSKTQREFLYTSPNLLRTQPWVLQGGSCTIAWSTRLLKNARGDKSSVLWFSFTGAVSRFLSRTQGCKKAFNNAVGRSFWRGNRSLKKSHWFS